MPREKDREREGERKVRKQKEGGKRKKKKRGRRWERRSRSYLFVDDVDLLRQEHIIHQSEPGKPSQ